MMIEIFVRNPNEDGSLRRKYDQIPNGPFPITEAQLMQARKGLEAKKAATDDVDRLGGCWVTEARIILKRIAPQLTQFDLLCMGHAVAMRHVRVELPSDGDVE